MADTQETIADIIAEFRGYSAGMPASYHVTMSWADFRKMLDRFEAAHKREADYAREAYESALKAEREALREQYEAGALVDGTRGDCAKLREALKDIVRIVEQIHLLYSDFPYEIHDIVRKARAALAAPARNCDKVKTSWDVLKEWHEGLDTANDVVRLLDWLLAPATETEGGNNGNE